MIFIQYDEFNRVIYRNYSPFSEEFNMGKTKEELEEMGIFVDSIPLPKDVFGKRPILKINLQDNSLYYEYVDRPLTEIEQIERMKDNLKTASEKYIELNINDEDIEVVRALKIEQLKECCTESIYEGFISLSLGYAFGFNEVDQANFSQQYLLVISGDNPGGNIKWKSKSGVVTLTEIQFRTLIKESKEHKLKIQFKYWTLENQVLQAKTNQEIDNIVW